MPRLQSLVVRGLGCFAGLHLQLASDLVVFVGENGTGKTWLLKLLYAITRAAQRYWLTHEGPQASPWPALLAEKLQWVFLPDTETLALGRLVRKGHEKAEVELGWEGGKIAFSWGARATKELAHHTEQGLKALEGISAVFLPPKEVLTMAPAIRETREHKPLAAFDDTYLDLWKDYQADIPKGAPAAFVRKGTRKLYEATGGGDVVMDQKGRIWWKKNKQWIPIALAAEGVKKAGVLFRLLRNRRLDLEKGGFLFVDEPEANLHPRAEVAFAELLFWLAEKTPVQVFLATHSYFVLKRLQQLARRKKSEHAARLVDLRDDGQAVQARLQSLSAPLPEDNPIIAQSLQLLHEDMELDYAEALGDD